MEESIMPRKIHGDFFMKTRKPWKEYDLWDDVLVMGIISFIWILTWNMQTSLAAVENRVSDPLSFMRVRIHVFLRVKYVALLRVKNLDVPVKGR
jgi:hypothetical protein